MQRALQRLLQREGYAVTTAAHGLEGLARLAQQTYAVILCDIHMPCLNGIEFYYALRQRSPYLVSHLIFLTGDGMSPEVRDFFAHIPCPYLLKPFKSQQLLHLMQHVIAGPDALAPSPPGARSHVQVYSSYLEHLHENHSVGDEENLRGHP